MNKGTNRRRGEEGVPTIRKGALRPEIEEKKVVGELRCQKGPASVGGITPTKWRVQSGRENERE